MHSIFKDEILEQPEALSLAIDKYPYDSSALDRIRDSLRGGRIRHVVLTGMGASLYSCYPLWLSLNSTRIPASMWDTSELVNHSPAIINDDTLLIVVSQSGESAEIDRLISLGKRTGNIIAITNNPNSQLANWTTPVLYQNAGEEKSVSTKTYLSSLAILHLLGCQLAGGDVEKSADQLRQVAGKMQSYLSEWAPKTDSLGSFFGTIDVLALMGRGFSMASALYGALAFKEASKVFTFGLTSAQFRHGPIELTRPGFNAVVFSGSKATRGLNEQLAREIAGRGGKAMLVTSEPKGNESSCFRELPIPCVEKELLPLLELIPIQLLAIPLAKNRGYQAGVFEVGSKVTTNE